MIIYSITRRQIGDLGPDRDAVGSPGGLRSEADLVLVTTQRRNARGRNRADGAGYQLLAAQALEIDRFNPHVAARMLGSFESWRILEPGRQARAKAVLEDLAAKSLSTDSYEIVTKTLEAA